MTLDNIDAFVRLSVLAFAFVYNIKHIGRIWSDFQTYYHFGYASVELLVIMFVHVLIQAWLLVLLLGFLAGVWP